VQSILQPQRIHESNCNRIYSPTSSPSDGNQTIPVPIASTRAFIFPIAR